MVWICCSTPANWASSLVKVSEVIGLVGSWFCSCVVSRVRNWL